ncbi:unnamed protein product [Rotaria magnacalcarata]|uniref:Uncharacterized protein n=1 Tax=Rotaria magnacalcarata TaxID=392030 RepID=A0A816XD34_9BILA|nr:unnamed protein product [Rotaria magnacalcarata]CAF2145441.1 unnamed protein product [Rotaria magnacalcarata]
MLSGQLDPSTVFQQASSLAAITTKTRAFYAIPLAGHVTVNIAQVGYLCSLTLTLSWLFPTSWSDTQCIQDLPTTVDFVGATAMGQQYSLKLLNVSLPFGVFTSNSI